MTANDDRFFHPGQVGAATGLGLNLSFVFLTLADAFTVFKGVDLLGTSALGRLALGETLSRREFGRLPRVRVSVRLRLRLRVPKKLSRR